MHDEPKLPGLLPVVRQRVRRWAVAGTNLPPLVLSLAAVVFLGLALLILARLLTVSHTDVVEARDAAPILAPPAASVVSPEPRPPVAPAPPATMAAAPPAQRPAVVVPRQATPDRRPARHRASSETLAQRRVPAPGQVRPRRQVRSSDQVGREFGRAMCARWIPRSRCDQAFDRGRR